MVVSIKSTTFAPEFMLDEFGFLFYMTDNQKNNIVLCASRMMRSAGIRSVSIDDICHELGISKKTFYVYFSTKDLLVDDILLLYEKSVQEEVSRKTKGKSIKETVRGFAKSTSAENDVRKLPPLLYDLKKYYPQQLDAHMQRLRLIICEMVRQLLIQGVKEGFFRSDIDVPAVAEILSSLHAIMMEKYLQDFDRKKIVNNSRIALDIFFRGLVSDEGRRQLEEQML